MTRLSKNQQGFSALEFIMIIVILVIIGAIGFIVYKNRPILNISTNSNTNSKPNSVKTNSYSNWQYYSNSTYGLSFDYPPSWNVHIVNSSPVNGLDIYVSKTSAPQTLSNGIAANYESKYLGLYIFIANRPTSKISTNPDYPYLINLGSISYNQTTYSLVGSQPLTPLNKQVTKSIANVEVENCPSGLISCNPNMPTANGGSINLNITSMVTTQNPTIPINLGSLQYLDAILILKSLKF